jgi:hypothetical protein
MADVKRDDSIDCAEFLRLTGARLGAHGIHRIAFEGVTAEMTPDSIANSPGGSAEQATLLDFVRDARLDFPTTPKRLVEWWDLQGGDFCLPDWFVAAVQEPEVADERMLERKAELTAALHVLEKQKTRKTSNQLLHKRKSRELESELSLIEGWLNRRQISTDRMTLESPKRRRRNMDAMTHEIINVLNSLGANASPDQVMAALKRNAGAPGSCVEEAIPKGILWRRLGKQPEVMSRAALHTRLRRLHAAAASERDD